MPSPCSNQAWLETPRLTRITCKWSANSRRSINNATDEIDQHVQELCGVQTGVKGSETLISSFVAHYHDQSRGVGNMLMSAVTLQ
jgi:hypothetical protein